MKALVWIVFAVFALFWTGGAVVASELTRWTAEAVASGEAVELGRAATQWPVPDWMAWWVDPALVQAAQRALLWMLDTTSGFLPWAGAALGWLVPVIWVTWALGLLAVLLLAVGLHVLVKRVAAPGSPSPAR